MRLRRVLLLVAASCFVSRTAYGQDRLFVHLSDGTPAGRDVEIGAFGRFGEPIGPAPADAFTRLFPAGRHFVAVGDAIVETASGAVVFAAGTGETIAGWAASPDATRLYVATVAGFVPTTRAIDVDSRAVVAEAPGVAGPVVWLPGDRVLVDYRSGHYLAFDRDLRPFAELALQSRCASEWMVSHHTGRAYVVTYEGYNGSFISAVLTAFDTVAGRYLGRVELGAANCFGAGATLWSAPGAPQRLAATVAGREVRLSWLATDLAEGYVVDVGVAPGRTDLTVFVGSTTGVIFANAPSGTYYVRIRAGNVMGGGRPSAEVPVVVP